MPEIAACWVFLCFLCALFPPFIGKTTFRKYDPNSQSTYTKNTKITPRYFCVFCVRVLGLPLEKCPFENAPKSVKSVRKKRSTSRVDQFLREMGRATKGPQLGATRQKKALVLRFFACTCETDAYFFRVPSDPATQSAPSSTLLQDNHKTLAYYSPSDFAGGSEFWSPASVFGSCGSRPNNVRIARHLSRK